MTTKHNAKTLVINISMEDYHYAWLLIHPNRTTVWLRAKLAEGFHIHHIDGNHNNNIPDNLILIEGSDHMALHGMDLRGLARGPKTKKKKKKTRADIAAEEFKYVTNRMAMKAACYKTYKLSCQ